MDESAYRQRHLAHRPDSEPLDVVEITSTARKSMKEIRNAPLRSRANDVRYWSFASGPGHRRGRRKRTTDSTTLHHELS